MTLPVFDGAHHHVGLGADSSTLKGYMVAGAYSKQLANPVFGKPSNVGTDDLVGLRSLSNLTQDDYSGGEFQEDWSDPAMFSECVSMLPDQLTRRLRTTRPLKSILLNDLGSGAGDPISLEHIGGYIFLVFNNGTPAGRVFRYHVDDPTTSSQKETVSSTYLPAGKLITAAAWNRNAGRLWLGSDEPAIETFTWDGSLASGSRLVHQTSYDSPGGTKITGIHIWGKLKIIVTVNRNSDASSIGEDDSSVWLYVSGTGTSAKFTRVGYLPGNFVKAVTYNNAIYILSRGAGTDDDRSYLSMTQGSQVFPVVEFPYFFRAASMCEYAGRLYIGGTGFDLDGTAHHGELFEVSGASLRLVRTFASHAWKATSGTQTGTQNKTGTNGTVPIRRNRPMTMLKDLCVAEGLLWMPDDSWTGVEAYDATTDALFGGPRFREGNDTSIEFTKILTYGSSIYLWGKGTTAAKTGLYRTEIRSDSGNGYDAYMITSDIAPEPSRDKMWSRLVVHSLGPVTPSLYYSTDSGDSWSSAVTGTTSTSGNTTVSTFDLVAAGLTASKRIRFKISFPMTGAAAEASAFLCAHSLSFTVRGDTKRRWQMTIIATNQVEDLERDTVAYTPSEVSSTLWTLKDQAAPVSFTDMDGTNYNVVISDIADHHTALDPDAERFVQLSLLEV